MEREHDNERARQSVAVIVVIVAGGNYLPSGRCIQLPGAGSSEETAELVQLLFHTMALVDGVAGRVGEIGFRDPRNF